MDVLSGIGNQLVMIGFVYLITALEAYLSGTLVNRLLQDKAKLHRLVEGNSDFRERKFVLSEIFQRSDTIEEEVRLYLSEVVWHNLPKAKALYEITFNFDFPDIAQLTRAVRIRHDIVHRNGFDSKGAPITVSPQ
jgi:hypothetical protein